MYILSFKKNIQIFYAKRQGLRDKDSHTHTETQTTALSLSLSLLTFIFPLI